METPITQFSRTIKFESHIMQRLRLAVSTGMLVAIASLSSSCIGNEGDVALRSQAASTTVAGGDTRNFNGAGQNGSSQAELHAACARDSSSASCETLCLSFPSDSICGDVIANRQSAGQNACLDSLVSPACVAYCRQITAPWYVADSCRATHVAAATVPVVSVRPEDAQMDVEVRARPVAVVASDLGRPFQISAGPQHSCGISISSSQEQVVVCWGRNHKGQLGNGSHSDSRIPVRVQGLPNQLTVRQVVTGGDPEMVSAFSCAMVDTPVEAQQVFCWGSNSYGELGNNTGRADRLTAMRVNVGEGSPLMLAAGFAHVCSSVRHIRGRIGVQCWGRNHRGQLGMGTLGGFAFESDTPLSVQVAYPNFTPSSNTAPIWAHPTWTGKKFISAQGNHTCLDAGGGTRLSRLICWGENASEELARSSAEFNSCGRPSDTAPCVTLAGGSAGGAATIRVDRSSTNASDGLTLGRIYLGTGGTNGVDERMLFAVGVNHVCASATDGVRCFGGNENGQLGVNPRVWPRLPAPAAWEDNGGARVNGLIDPVVGGDASSKGILEVRSGYDFSCIRFIDQSIQCWGWNITGALAQDPNRVPTSFIPLPVMGRGTTGGGFAPNQIALSSFNSLILWRGDQNPARSEVSANRALNPVYGLGRNDFGQLGSAPRLGDTLSLTSTPVAAFP